MDPNRYMDIYIYIYIFLLKLYMWSLSTSSLNEFSYIHIGYRIKD